MMMIRESRAALDIIAAHRVFATRRRTQNSERETTNNCGGSIQIIWCRPRPSRRRPIYWTRPISRARRSYGSCWRINSQRKRPRKRDLRRAQERGVPVAVAAAACGEKLGQAAVRVVGPRLVEAAALGSEASHRGGWRCRRGGAYAVMARAIVASGKLAASKSI